MSELVNKEDSILDIGCGYDIICLNLLIRANKKYRYVFLLGYTMGATIAWLSINEDNMCDGMVF